MVHNCTTASFRLSKSYWISSHDNVFSSLSLYLSVQCPDLSEKAGNSYFYARACSGCSWRWQRPCWALSVNPVQWGEVVKEASEVQPASTPPASSSKEEIPATRSCQLRTRVRQPLARRPRSPNPYLNPRLSDIKILVKSYQAFMCTLWIIKESTWFRWLSIVEIYLNSSQNNQMILLYKHTII